MQQLTCVDEGVGVLLEEQVLQDAALGHQAEQVVVAAKEDVQPAARVSALGVAAWTVRHSGRRPVSVA